MNCQICKRVLNDPADPTTRDCGGDCLRCMAEVGEDPDCVREMLEIAADQDAGRAFVAGFWIGLFAGGLLGLAMVILALVLRG